MKRKRRGRLPWIDFYLAKWDMTASQAATEAGITAIRFSQIRLGHEKPTREEKRAMSRIFRAPQRRLFSRSELAA